MLHSKRKPEMETKGGRLILRGQLYSRMRKQLCKEADGRCEILVSPFKPCGKYTPLHKGEAHHSQHRGLGGAKRDDRIYISGQRNLFWACQECHNGEHVPAKVVPAKVSDTELRELLGVAEHGERNETAN